jgi:hypothetical protein
MLDSLVRVSRRVGWRADRCATDPVPAGPPGPSKEAVGRHGCPVPASRTPRESQAAYAGGGSSVPRADRVRRAYNSERRGAHLPCSPPSDRPRTGRGALPAESAHGCRPTRQGESPIRSPTPRRATGFRAESRGPTLRIHPFTSRRFHVLLNSLFKVLFNFPSRYLSAIGLVPVFSLRWSLPPALGCIPKQPDS